jgi:hypothetical protein
LFSVIASVVLFSIFVEIILRPISSKLWNRAKDSFLLLFPYGHQHHEVALQTLKETESPYNEYAKKLLHLIARHKWEIAYLKCDISQLPIWRKLQSIILPYNKKIKYLAFFPRSMRLLLTSIFLYLFIFCDCSWWTVIYNSIGIYVVWRFLAGAVIFLSLTKLFSFNTKSFFKLFPENHPDQSIAIDLLLSFNSQYLCNLSPFSSSFKLYGQTEAMISDVGSALLRPIFTQYLEKGLSLFKQDDWKNAQKYLNNAANIAQKIVDRGYEEKHILIFELALARFYLGTCLLRTWQISTAIKELEKARELYRLLLGKGHKAAIMGLTETQTSIAVAHGHIGDLLAEKQTLQENIEGYKLLINQKNEINIDLIIFISKNLDFTSKTSSQRYQEFLGLYRKTPDELKEKLVSLQAKLGVCLFRLGDIYEACQHLEEAQDYFQMWLDAVYPDLFENDAIRNMCQIADKLQVKLVYNPHLSLEVKFPKCSEYSRFDDISFYRKKFERREGKNQKNDYLYRKIIERLEGKNQKDNYWQKIKIIFKSKNLLKYFQKTEKAQKRVIKEYFYLFAELATTRKYLGLCLQQSTEPSDLEMAQKLLSKNVVDFMALAQIQPELRLHFADASITLGDYHIIRSEFSEAQKKY